jgi:hypothetical protein
MSTQAGSIEEKCYYLQAKLNVIMRLSIAFLGKKKVKKLEKNLDDLIRNELDRLKELPLDS